MDKFKTFIVNPNYNNIAKASYFIKNSDIIGVPTETVYGLAANAYDEFAIKKIFEAKGRPQDNPLIVHISNLNMLYDLVDDVCDIRKKLIDNFWPGPLTIIFPKSNIVSNVVTAGLDTIAIRFPSNKIFLELISCSNLPLAAPSANISGKPSPTSAIHVYNDLCGKIPLIIDGEKCDIGIESTVINVCNGKIQILRPGYVTLQDLESVFNYNIIVEDLSMSILDKNSKVMSPGLKYKHYSPNANVIIIDSSLENFKKYLQSKNKLTDCALVFNGEENDIDFNCYCYGLESDPLSQARLLFDKMRLIDTKKNIMNIYVRHPNIEGIGFGVYNRLLRSSNFEVIKIV